VTVILDRVPLDLVERMWEHIEPHIRAGCEAVTSEVTPEFIHAEALADRRTIWCAFDTDSPFPFLAAASVGFRDTPKGRVFYVDAIGGRDRDKWLAQCLTELEDQARSAGMYSGEFEGRKGWQPVLEKLGYRVVRVVMEKVL
jgi:hypothetical protein